MNKYIKTVVLFIVATSVCMGEISAQVDLRNIILKGRVFDSEGSALTNVSVTDGYNIVQTNTKGEYELLSNGSAEYVYISIPSGYEIPMKDQVPLFFHSIPQEYEEKYVFDFELRRLPVDDNQHVSVVWSDPQVYYEEELEELQLAVDDLKDLINTDYRNVAIHGIVPGDMIGWIKDADKLFPAIKNTIANTDIPFFYAVGNHDMDATSRSNLLSKVTYKKYFGPNYYSFNRGRIHYIVLDNVFYTARNNASIGYLDDQQMDWLEQDLATIPHGSTVIVTMHIPSYSPEARRNEVHKEQMHRVLQNREPLYKMLEPYNVHIFSGHEHYLENYQIKENIFEHVHTTLSGLFWMAPWSWDGSPRGYTVYEIDGDEVKWYFKAVGKDKNHQFNVYAVGANKQKANAITVNVWNYDPAWKVYWYENDELMGEMTPFTGYDSSIVDYVTQHQSSFKHKGIGAAPTEHMFYAIPKLPDSVIRIEVIDRFGSKYIEVLDKAALKLRNIK